MNISAFDVIYNELVYKCVDVMTDFCSPIQADMGVKKPKMLYVTCINSDGNIVMLQDETFMFRFIRKGGAPDA